MLKRRGPGTKPYGTPVARSLGTEALLTMMTEGKGQ